MLVCCCELVVRVGKIWAWARLFQAQAQAHIIENKSKLFKSPAGPGLHFYIKYKIFFIK